MDVRSICSERGVTIRPLPDGQQMPAESISVEGQLETLTELDFALNSLVQLMQLDPQVRAILGQQGQPGGLSDHTWDVWIEATNALHEQTGIAPAELNIEALIKEVVNRLQAEDDARIEEEKTPINAGDIIKLKGLLELLAGVYGPIREALQGDQYPQAATVFSATYIENRSFKLILKGILEKINQALSTEVSSRINLAQIDWSSLSALSVTDVISRVNLLISESCEDYNALVPEPPVIVPPPPPPPPPPPVTTPEPEDELKFNFALSLAPAYGLLIYGNENDPPFENTFSLHGMAGARLDFNEDLSLQIDYSGFHNVSQDFSYSRVSQDSAYVSLAIENYIPQLGFLTQHDNLNGERSFLGAAGLGINLSDGLFYPFAGGLAGTSFGGYAGIRSSYTWEELMKLNVSGQLFYSYLDGHEAGASASVSFSPVSFLGNDLQIGIGASGAYADESAGILAGLTLSYGPLLAPQPVSVRQLIGGY